MRLATEERIINKIGDTGTRHTTQIRGSAHVMAAIAGLYSNLPRAVIREYLSNAYDGHVRAKTLDKPIILHLPNILEPYLEIRDFGTGMTPEQLETVFNNIGDSTKLDTDEENGCLGFGSKVAFCYSRDAAWTIESRHNGMLYVYWAYVDDKGLSGVEGPIDAQGTDEENGITIRIPVEQKDFEKFYKEAVEVVRFFPSPVNVVAGPRAFEAPRPNYVVSTDKWGYIGRSSNAYYNNVRLVMGTVAYPVKLTEVGIDGSVLNKSDFDLFVPMGAVRFTPSREALIYDANTCALIKQLSEEMLNAVVDHVTKDIGTQTSLWDAAVKFKQLESQFFLNESGVESLFKGRAVGRQIKVPITDILTFGTGIQIEDCRVRHSSRYDAISPYQVTRDNIMDLREVSLDIQPFDRHIATGVVHLIPETMPGVIFDDAKRAGVKKSRVLMHEHFKGKKAVVFRGTNWNMAAISKVLDGVPLFFTSSVPDNKAPTRKVALKSLGSRGWLPADVDLDEDDGCYVHLVHNDAPPYSFYQLQSIVETANILGYKVHPIGIPASRKSAIKGRDNWVNLFDVIKAKVLADSRLTVPEETVAILSDKQSEIRRFMEFASIKNVPQDILDFANVVKALGSLSDLKNLQSLILNLHIQRPPSNAKDTLGAHLAILEKKYEAIMSSWDRDRHYGFILRAINAYTGS